MHVLLALWVVLYRDDIPQDAESKLAGATVVARMPEIDTLVVAAGKSFASQAAADPDVAFVGEDLEMRMIDDVVVAIDEDSYNIGRYADPMYSLQWDKQRIHASPTGSYPMQQGRPEVTVAVLDTGAEAAHPDIAPNLDVHRSRAFYPVQDDPNGVADPVAWDDRNGHGTWCLSAVGAPINGIGISGVAPRVTLVALKVLGDHGSGTWTSAAQALLYSAGRFDIVSMSFIGHLQRGNANHEAMLEMMQRAVAYTRGRGTTPIAAMGNDGLDITDPAFSERYASIPATLDGVIAISATNWSDAKTNYSNYGWSTAAAAPGGDANDPLLGAWAPDSRNHPGDYAWLFGTSMACPNAAGVAALIVSLYGDFSPYRARGPHLAPDYVERYLLGTATPLGDAYFYGAGMVDALAAVNSRTARTASPPSGR